MKYYWDQVKNGDLSSDISADSHLPFSLFKSLSAVPLNHQLQRVSLATNIPAVPLHKGFPVITYCSLYESHEICDLKIDLTLELSDISVR